MNLKKVLVGSLVLTMLLGGTQTQADSKKHKAKVVKTNEVNTTKEKKCDFKKYKIVSMKFVCTGYCNCSKCSGVKSYIKHKGITASGSRASRGICASPRHIPFDSVIVIPKLGRFVVKDRGGAIKRLNRNTIKIDIWFPNHREAKDFGTKTYNGQIHIKN